MIREIQDRLNKKNLTVEEIDDYIEELRKRRKQAFDYNLFKDNIELQDGESETAAFSRVVGLPFNPAQFQIRSGSKSGNTISIWKYKVDLDAFSQYSDLIDELEKERINIKYAEPTIDIDVEESEPEEVINPYRNLSDSELKNRISNVWNSMVNSFDGEISDDDPIIKEYDDLIAEDSRRREEASMTDVSIMDTPVEIETPTVEDESTIAPIEPVEDTTYSLNKSQIIQDDLSVDDVEEKFTGGMSDEEIEAARRNLETPAIPEEPKVTEEVVEEKQEEQPVQPTNAEISDEELNSKIAELLAERDRRDAARAEAEVVDNEESFENDILTEDEEITDVEPEELKEVEPKTEDNSLASVSTEDIKKRLNSLWNTADTSSEVENDDVTDKEYHELLNELENRRAEVVQEELEEKQEEPQKEPQVSTITRSVAPAFADNSDTESEYDETDFEDSEEPQEDSYEDEADSNSRESDDNEPSTEDDFDIDDYQPSLRSYQDIVNEVVRDIDEDGNEVGLDLTEKATKKIRVGKISVTKNFANRIKQGNGNFLYGLLGAASGLVFSVIPQGVSAISGKLYSLFHKKHRENYNTIVDRLQGLEESDLKILANEFDPDKVKSSRNQRCIAPMIQDRVNEYIRETKIVPLQERIADLSLELAKRYKRVDDLVKTLKDGDDDWKESIYAEIQEASEGSADLIHELDTKKFQLQTALSGRNSLHTTDETAKLSQNYSADFGRRFAKKINLKEGYEFDVKRAELQRGVKEGIYNDDDFKALLNFGQLQTLEISNTEVKNTIFGKKSVGLYNWQVMPTESNYSSDPFYQYLFQTIACVGIVKGITDTIHNSKVEKITNDVNQQNKAVEAKIEAANEANINASNQNAATMNQINATGRNLESNGDAYARGIEGLAQKDIVGQRSVGEYNAYDAKNIGQDYSTIDSASHAETRAAWEQLESDLSAAKKAYTSGNTDIVSHLEAVEAARQAVHGSFISEINNFRNTLTDYCAKYPQYDYEPIQSAMDSIINNPSTLDNMVDGMIYSVKAGKTLQEAVSVAYTPISVRFYTAPAFIMKAIEPVITTALLAAYMDKENREYVKLEKLPNEISKIYMSTINDLNKEEEIVEEDHEEEYTEEDFNDVGMTLHDEEISQEALTNVIYDTLKQKKILEVDDDLIEKIDNAYPELDNKDVKEAIAAAKKKYLYECLNGITRDLSSGRYNDDIEALYDKYSMFTREDLDKLFNVSEEKDNDRSI